MDNIKKQLRRARPSLKLVSPMSYWIILLMGIFNIALGISLLTHIDSSRLVAPLLIVNNVLTFNVWGIVFVILGMIKLYSLYSNNWKLSRRSLLFGVAIKATWGAALIMRVFIGSGTVLLTLVWITLALMQMGCYIYFFPPLRGPEVDHAD